MSAIRPASVDPDVPGVRILPPILFLAVLVAAFLLQWVWSLRMVPGELVLMVRAIGMVLVVLAFALGLSAVSRFRKAGTNVSPLEPVTVLVLEGPYRFTRNPMYLGFVLLTTGVAGIANSLWPIVLLVPALVILQRGVIEPEERFLERKFGAEYRVYKARVRRWI